MGDHRNDSADSRYHCGDPGPGPNCDPLSSTVPVSDVIGKAVVIAWPPSRWRTLGTPKTFTSLGLPGLGALPAEPAAFAVAGVGLVRLAASPAAMSRGRAERRPAAAATAGRILLVDDQRRVLLIHDRLDLDATDSHWIAPGGGLEPGETPAEAAVREVYEETGLRVQLPPDAQAMLHRTGPVHLRRPGHSTRPTTTTWSGCRPACRCGRPPTPSLEKVVALGHRWWPLAELAASPVVREPVTMVELIRQAIGGEQQWRRRSGAGLAPAGRPAPTPPPTLRLERQIWRTGAGLLAAVDEVGRGALAGPVSVGVVLLDAQTKPAPFGVADSKLLTPQARQRLVPRIRRWAADCAVGHAEASEIDRIGVIAALRLAAERAVSQLSRRRTGCCWTATTTT